MSAKLITLLREFVISSKLADPETVQAWEEEGEIDVNLFGLSIDSGDTESLSNDIEVRLHIASMPLEDIDKIKVVVTRFVRFYASNTVIKFATSPHDKLTGEVLFMFTASELMNISNSSGMYNISYCTAPLEAM
jgi:hypothetical protein